MDNELAERIAKETVTEWIEHELDDSLSNDEVVFSISQRNDLIQRIAEKFGRHLSAQQPAGEWQPIKSAPRDRTKILLYCARWDHPVREHCLSEAQQWAKGYEPTHWIPLPTPPDAGIHVASENIYKRTEQFDATVVEGEGDAQPLRLTRENGSFIPAVYEQILIKANCGVSGHFRFQENGGNCMMCQRTAALEIDNKRLRQEEQHFLNQQEVVVRAIKSTWGKLQYQMERAIYATIPVIAPPSPVTEGKGAEALADTWERRARELQAQGSERQIATAEALWACAGELRRVATIPAVEAEPHRCPHFQPKGEDSGGAYNAKIIADVENDLLNGDMKERLQRHPRTWYSSLIKNLIQRVANLRVMLAEAKTDASSIFDSDLAEAQRLYERLPQGKYLVGPDVDNLPYKYEAFVYSQNIAKARFLHKEDAEFYAAAHNLWPRLVARAQGADAVWDEAIRAVQSVYMTVEPLTSPDREHYATWQTAVTDCEHALEAARAQSKGEKP